MSFSLSDLASTFSKGDCKDGQGSNNLLLIAIIILVLCGCSSKGFFGGSYCDPCRRPVRNSGNAGGLLSGPWIIIIIILLCAGNNGLAGFGGSSGNLNTNIINVDRDYYDDEY